jgi:DNA-binding IclR family transcriptional regulator
MRPVSATGRVFVAAIPESEAAELVNTEQNRLPMHSDTIA